MDTRTIQKRLDLKTSVVSATPVSFEECLKAFYDFLKCLESDEKEKKEKMERFTNILTKFNIEIEEAAKVTSKCKKNIKTLDTLYKSLEAQLDKETQSVREAENELVKVKEGVKERQFENILIEKIKTFPSVEQLEKEIKALDEEYKEGEDRQQKMLDLWNSKREQVQQLRDILHNLKE